MREVLPLAWLLSALTLFAATPAVRANGADLAAALVAQLVSVQLA